MEEMCVLIQFVRQLRADGRGVAAIEYGLIASLVAVAIISSLTRLGGNLNNTFSRISAGL